MPVLKAHCPFSLSSQGWDNQVCLLTWPWPHRQHCTGTAGEQEHTSTTRRDDCGLVSESLKSNLLDHSWMWARHNDPRGLLVVRSAGFHIWPMVYHRPSWKENVTASNGIEAFKTRTQSTKSDWKKTSSKELLILFSKTGSFHFLSTRVICLFFLQ